MSDRTAQQLTTRLAELSSVAMRSGAAATAIASLLESASVATMHAVALELQCGAPVREVPALAPARPTLVRLLDAA
jgi:2-methylcitrate dehydratase PrpD